MKKILSTMALTAGLGISLWSQPTITLVGSSPSLSKGNLNAEVITEIIQQKQSEVKQRVFRNTVVTHFNSTSHKEHLNNFLTYHYLYNVMDVITSGKNKTFITKSVTQSSAEFAYVYGLALYTLSKNPKPEFDNKLIKFALVTYSDTSGSNASKVRINQKSIEDINVLLDICYDVVLRDTSLRKTFSFKDNFNDKEFLTWYNSDNAYLKEIKSAKEQKDQARIDQLQDLYKAVVTNLAELQKFQNTTTELYTNLSGFYSNLSKSEYKDFSMTRGQYDSFRYIINQFLTLSRNQTQSDVVALVIEYLQENTIVEFQNSQGDVVMKEDNNAARGYLYVDIESLITSLADKFKLNGKYSGKYVQLFFTVGTNYSSFINDENLLGINSVGGRKPLHNMYFASEKIGIRLKLWNWKYTHSFGAGETYRYYNMPGTSRCWLRPQEKPLVSDLHLMAYGSGILYNLAPMNSEEEFNYAIGGIGIGATFFNGLTVSCSYACPFTDNKFTSTNSFINVGMDVPIVEYISALRNKNK